MRKPVVELLRKIAKDSRRAQRTKALLEPLQKEAQRRGAVRERVLEVVVKLAQEGYTCLHDEDLPVGLQKRSGVYLYHDSFKPLGFIMGGNGILRCRLLWSKHEECSKEKV